MLELTLTAAEAAHLWRLDESTVRNALNADRLHGRKSAGTRLVPLAEMVRVYGPMPDPQSYFGPAFWTITREKNESLHSFIFRTWRTANPTVTDEESVRPDTGINPQIEVVREGWGSPYNFGRILRALAGRDDGFSDSPGIFSGEWVEDGFTRTIYYAWGALDRDGPHMVVFYDPNRADTFGRPYPIHFRMVDGLLHADLGKGDLAHALTAVLEAEYGGCHIVQDESVLYYNGAYDQEGYSELYYKVMRDAEAPKS